LDSIQKVIPLEVDPDYGTYQKHLKDGQPYFWGVSTGSRVLEHIEMTLTVEAKDIHIAHRLEREKRCGTVERLGETGWRFRADIYDAWELMPWLRTFTGRIASLSCSNKQVEEQFWADYAALSAMYGGGADVV
jgi:hypothetical protein